MEAVLGQGGGAQLINTVIPLGILGGGVPPASPNPDPISDQKCHFPYPFSDLASKIHTHFQI